MLAVTTLGNELNVVAIGTYCHDSTLIATNNVVAIDPISSSELGLPGLRPSRLLTSFQLA
jgi:hypothetical protein